MYHNRFYTPEIHGPYDLISIGELQLERGGVIADCELAVATRGQLNEARDNAILITTWFGGTHQSWLDSYVGGEHALDPAKYFIVVINQIGNGLSTSPHNTTDESIAMARFPEVTIGDDVVAQERLLREHFGIQQLYAVVGAAMGAEQAWEWAVRFPDQVKRAAPIAGTAQTTAHDQMFTEVLTETITSDPGFNDGDYPDNTAVRDGLARHTRLWMLLGLSTEFWKQEAWRNLGFATREAVVTEFFEPLVAAMDPNALTVMAGKWRGGGVSRHAGGDVAAALNRITARVFALAIDEDMFFPVRDIQAEQELVPGAQLRVISDIAGHFALFGLHESYIPQVDRHLQELLDS